ncbi:STAS domain-containing protein [Streptomyces naganishii]|uniref:Sulfate transporter n=1 Tax=Streptomyces naganishii JCM 4654 TaxID=1306179 RepID=A0A918Y1D4_9ACTN|nr:STAS domain-containing protein [Streptomyces naganishii]GHD85827.1 sulfate transporter [Streptomyces naganishii JCM 4654]
MTTVQPSPLTLTLDSRDHAVVVRVGGDLDYAGHDEFLHAVTTLLARRHAARHPVRELRLDFSGLRGVDSSGLSALLRIRRRTDEAGIALHLDERPAALERLLEMTGTLELLTAPPVRPGVGARPTGS